MPQIMDDDRGDSPLIDHYDGLQNGKRRRHSFPGTDLNDSLPRKEANVSKYWPFALAIMLSVLLLSTLFYSDHQQSKIPTPNVHNQDECGHSAEEAHQNGCVYSFIPGAWIPLRCHDSEMEAEFLRQKEWHWWADNATQQEISLEFIRTKGGENPIHVTNEYHDYHCAFTWKLLHRAVIRHSLIDSYIGNFSHTKHCARSLENAWRRKPSISTFYPIYASCMDPNFLDPVAADGLAELGHAT